VHQLLRDALEEIADAARVVELQVKIVDEEQEDPSRHVRTRAAGRKDDPFRRRRRRRRQDVGHTSAGHDRHRRDVLLHTVFENLEIFFLEVRDEIALLVANDDVVRHEIDLDLEGRPLLRRRGIGWRGRRLTGCLS
jgi:hypothetical protein